MGWCSKLPVERGLYGVGPIELARLMTSHLWYVIYKSCISICTIHLYILYIYIYTHLIFYYMFKLDGKTKFANLIFPKVQVDMTNT